MKPVFAFLTLCLALAVFRALLIVLAVVLLLALLHAFIKRPRETLGFLGTVALFGLAAAQPLACIIGVTVIATAVVLVKRRQKTSRPAFMARLK